MKKLTLSVLAIAAVVPSFAVTIDGFAEAAYGPALFTQNIQTQFGDSNLGQPEFANGSEIDGVFAFNDGTNLNIVVTGNLETNFNKLVLFIDNGLGGGFNPLGTGHASGDDFGYINSVGGQGLTFDNAFSPQSALWVRAGFDGSNNTIYGTFATLGAAGSDTTANAPVNIGNPWTLAFGNGINTALDNSNTAGVTGGTGASSGAGVFTGFEAMIPLSAIGASAGSTIRVGGYITGGTFMSNQVIGGLPAGTGNLGNGAIDFNQFAGEQFVTVQGVPEPGTMIALGAGLAAFAARRRRK